MRSSKGTPMTRVPVSTLAAILALAACTPQPAAAPSSVPPVTITATTTVTATVTPSPAAPATAADLALGQPIEAPGVAKMTVSQFQTFPKGNHSMPLVGAMAQGCNLSSAAISFSIFPWTVAAADGSTFTVMGTFYGNDPVPRYPSQQPVAAGQCVKGWLLFEIPVGITITTIRYASQSDTVLLGTWKAA
jgi:hypothetical protein